MTSNPNRPVVILSALIVMLSITILFSVYRQLTQEPVVITINSQPIAPTIVPTITPIIADSTANLKTYSSGNYSFKYPSNWTKSTNGNGLNDPTNSFNLTVEVNSTEMDVNSWMQNKCYTEGDNFCSNPVKGPITDSIQYNHPKSQYDSIDTLVKFGGQIFDISLSSINPNQSADQTTKQIYNQILSTFKFIQ